MSGAAVFPGDFPDPFVVNQAGDYFAYGTNAADCNIQLLWSNDLVTWQHLGDTLPALPRWAQAGNTWAPSVVQLGETFVMYYTVREPRAGRQAISVATAPGPQGPFTDASSGPLVYQLSLGGSIDPSPFVDADGRPYLLWKADANALGRPSTLWIQPLTGTGLATVGSPTQLLAHDAAWENPLIEAPSVVASDGRYYLFYSANDWASANYSVGYAVADTLLGPYRKATTSAPWFASDAEVAGPGGQEFFVDAAGWLRMAYHGWQPGQVGYPGGARTLRIAQTTFEAGVPSLRW